MTKSSSPPLYTVAAPPSIPGGDAIYLASQLTAIANSLSGLRTLAAQSATVAPKVLLDGMIRLARNPWRPVAGQTADAWVYWDAAGSVWRFQATAPTNT